MADRNTIIGILRDAATTVKPRYVPPTEARAALVEEWLILLAQVPDSDLAAAWAAWRADKQVAWRWPHPTTLLRYVSQPVKATSASFQPCPTGPTLQRQQKAPRAVSEAAEAARAWRSNQFKARHPDRCLYCYRELAAHLSNCPVPFVQRAGGVG